MTDNADLITYLQGLAGGKGPATEATMAGIASKLGASIDRGNTVMAGSESSMKKLTSSLGGLVKKAGNLTNVLADGTESVVNFSKEQRKVSQVMKDFSSVIPIVSGLGRTASALISVLDDNMKSFQSLTTGGIYAGQRFNRLSQDAANLGIDLGKFTANVQSASGDVARLGMGGLNFFIEESTRAFDTNAESLMQFGYSFEETNEKFLSFLNQNSYAMRLYGNANVDLTKGTKDYSVFLRRLAELTGDQVDEAEDQIKKARANNIFNAFMQQIKDPAVRAKYDKIVATYGTMYGEQGREYAMSVIAGFQPMTKGAQQIGAMVQGLDGDLRMHKQFANNSAQNLDDFTRTMFTDVVGRTRTLQDQFGGGMTQTALAASMAGSDLDAGFQSIFGAMLKGTRSQEEIDAILDRIVEDEGTTLNEMAKANKGVQELRASIARELAQMLDDTGIMNGVITKVNNSLRLFKGAIDGFLEDQGAQDIKDVKGGEAEGGEATTKKILDGLPDDADLTNKVLQQALLYLKAIDDNTGKFIQGNEYTPAFSTREMQNIQDLLAKGQGGKLGSLPSIQEIMKVFTETTDGDQAKAQQMTIDAIRSFVNNPDNNYQGKDGMLRLLDSQKGAIKMYNKGTMGFGKLFENFGSGQMAMLHGEEAVIPKNSPIGGMLSMMQGDLGNLKESAFKDGKMNIGGMIESATKMGAKYDSYAKENSNAINDQGRGMVKSMTGMSDEQLDKVSQSSVQSNTSTSSAPAVNSMGGGKLDELIRINKQMLTELRNM